MAVVWQACCEASIAFYTCSPDHQRDPQICLRRHMEAFVERPDAVIKGMTCAARAGAPAS